MQVSVKLGLVIAIGAFAGAVIAQQEATPAPAPSGSKWSDITLKRGATASPNPPASVTTPPAPPQPVGQWNFQQAWPSKVDSIPQPPPPSATIQQPAPQRQPLPVITR